MFDLAHTLANAYPAAAVFLTVVAAAIVATITSKWI